MNDRGTARFMRLAYIRSFLKEGKLSPDQAIELLKGPLTPDEPATIVDDSNLLDRPAEDVYVLFEGIAPLGALLFTLDVLRRHKPGDRSEKDRYMAIAITDMEKLVAFYEKYLTT